MIRPTYTDAPHELRHTVGVPRYYGDATVEDRARAAIDAEINRDRLDDPDEDCLICAVIFALGIYAVIAAVILGLVWLCR